jgi:hypothetical protein
MSRKMTGCRSVCGAPSASRNNKARIHIPTLEGGAAAYIAYRMDEEVGLAKGRKSKVL